MQIYPSGTEVKTRIGRFTVKVPMYQYSIVVEIGDVQELAKRWTADEIGRCYGVVIETGQDCSPVVIFSTDATAAVVAHECLHLTHKIFRHIGYTPSIEEDEPHAYLLSYLFEAIWSRIEKKQIGFK